MRESLPAATVPALHDRFSRARDRSTSLLLPRGPSLIGRREPTRVLLSRNSLVQPQEDTARTDTAVWHQTDGGDRIPGGQKVERRGGVLMWLKRCRTYTRRAGVGCRLLHSWKTS